VTQAPKLGQNFLRDSQASARIVAALGDLSQSTVVEIGPGHGVITDLLIPRARKVIAVELDHSLALSLRARYSEDRLTVVEQDVLQFDFAAAAAEAGGKLLVIGNLPFYITSPILHRLAEAHASLHIAVLMVQREVADRVTASPGSRDYGLLSVTVQLYGPTTSLFTLPPEAFSPPPQVHSTVFRWRFAPRFEELGLNPATFTAFLRQAFAQKAKDPGQQPPRRRIDPALIAAALDQAAIPPQARAESLSIESLAALWHALNPPSAPPG